MSEAGERDYIICYGYDIIRCEGLKLIPLLCPDLVPVWDLRALQPSSYSTYRELQIVCVCAVHQKQTTYMNYKFVNNNSV